MSHASLAGVWHHVVHVVSFLCLSERDGEGVCVIWGLCFYSSISLFPCMKFCCHAIITHRKRAKICPPECLPKNILSQNVKIQSVTFRFILMETFLLEPSTIPLASGQLLLRGWCALWALGLCSSTLLWAAALRLSAPAFLAPRSAIVGTSGKPCERPHPRADQQTPALCSTWSVADKRLSHRWLPHSSGRAASWRLCCCGGIRRASSSWYSGIFFCLCSIADRTWVSPSFRPCWVLSG